MEKFIDPFGRDVNYLRLSVTEQCNLSCFYCRSNPFECGKSGGKGLLTVQEITMIAEAAVKL